MNYTIWTTTGCNLRCEYCYEGEKKAKTMSLKTAQKAIRYILSEEAGREREVLVGFHGGEPFLNFDIVRYFVVELKERLGERVSFAATTNGTVLSGEDLLFAGQQIQGLSVSLDGDQETHDEKRKDADGRGSHQRALHAAKIFQKYNPGLRVRMTFDHRNVRKLYHNICFLVDQSFRCLVANPDFYDEDWTEEDLWILEQEIGKVKERFNGKEILINLLEPMHLYCLGDCKGGITGQHIFPDGKLYPCLLSGGKPEFEIGDIETGVDQGKLGSILSHAGEQHEECRDCALATGCDGARCMILNKVVMGKWDSPIPVQCRMNQIRYQLNGIR